MTMHVSPAPNGDGTNSPDLVVISAICSCGNPIASHKCPNVGAARRGAQKDSSCRACGESFHQNLVSTTLSLECLYRQWSKAAGLLNVSPTGRLKMPEVTADTIRDMWLWIQGGMVGRATSTIQPDGTFAQPDTAAVLKRMASRAADAPPQPDELPEEDGITAVAPAVRAALEAAYHDDPPLGEDHPPLCDDGCQEPASSQHAPVIPSGEPQPWPSVDRADYREPVLVTTTSAPPIDDDFSSLL